VVESESELHEDDDPPRHLRGVARKLLKEWSSRSSNRGVERLAARADAAPLLIYRG